MNSRQTLGFWMTFLAFCILASVTVYPLGAFDFALPATVVVLTCAYAICGVFMYRYVREHPEALGKWFQ